METYVQCSDCDEHIPASAANCPVCLKVRTRQEIFDGISGNETPGKAKKENRFNAALWMVLGLAILFGGFKFQRHQAGERARKEKINNEARAAEEKLFAQQNKQQEAEEDKKVNPARYTPLPSKSSRVGVMSVSSDSPPAPPKDPDHKADTHWTVSGEVYDLVSLKPIPGVRLQFRAKSGGKSVLGKTDSKGRYRVRLIKSGIAYQMKLKHRKYSGDYVEESAVPFRDQAKHRRMDSYRLFLQSPLLHVPLSPPEDEDVVDHSFVLLPYD